MPTMSKRATGAREPRILVINPGSTSTKLAVFRGERCQVEECLSHPREELARYPRIADQYPYRRKVIDRWLREKGFQPGEFAAIAARGGLTKPIPGGVYAVTASLIEDLRGAKWGEHPCNLGAALAAEFSRQAGCPAFIVDPPTVDEMWDVARLTGHPDIQRTSIFHALSQRAAARRAARELKTRYEAANFVVVHMGGGISIGAHRRGQVVDVNNALHGEGPLAPQRSGSLPAGDLTRLCFSGKYTQQQILNTLTRTGGLVAHLGTTDCREVERRIARGDDKAALLYEVMAYQMAKQIGAMAAVMSGKVKAVVLTGGMASSRQLVARIKKYAGFVAPFKVYPKMEELGALAAGALCALKGSVKVREYR
jgi:butyrate kinase